MLTLEKVRTFERFNGDIDGHARTRDGGDISGITDDDWSVIEELCQSLYLVTSGKASAAFTKETEQRLLTETADERTREILRRLAMRQNEI